MKIEDNSPINFIENIFHYLSPFSAYQVEVDDYIYPTLEHAYQSLRVKPGPEREEIKNSRSPMDAWRIGQTYKNNPDLRVPNQDKAELMEMLMRAKLKQHDDIKALLIESGDRGLLKVYPTDYFWATGADGSGENIMGKIWMKLRDELK